jgi:hypothetical protein
MFLMGAYQEVMGSNHNMFGALHVATLRAVEEATTSAGWEGVGEAHEGVPNAIGLAYLPEAVFFQGFYLALRGVRASLHARHVERLSSLCKAAWVGHQLGHR